MRFSTSASPAARRVPSASRLRLALAAAALLVNTAWPAMALDLAYSFEDQVLPEDPFLDGFGANGFGITVTQDTIGATEGTKSMKLELLEPAFFEGALTANVLPFFSDPPGLDFIVFDLTITEEFADPEGFVDLGITIFGSTKPEGDFGQIDGLSVQFLPDQVSVGNLEVGTHQVRMNLLNAPSPLPPMPVQSFNEIFGDENSAPNDLIATGFNLYVNKSATAPWTGYIDNLRVGLIGGPNGGDYNGNGVVDAADYTVWRDNTDSIGGIGGDGTATGDLLGVPDGTIDQSDYDYWAQEFGTVIPASAPVPEPSTLGLMAAAATLALTRRSANHA